MLSLKGKEEEYTLESIKLILKNSEKINEKKIFNSSKEFYLN